MMNQTKFSVLISHPYDETTRTLCSTANSTTRLFLQASLQTADVTLITERTAKATLPDRTRQILACHMTYLVNTSQSHESTRSLLNRNLTNAPYRRPFKCPTQLCRGLELRPQSFSPHYIDFVSDSRSDHFTQ